MVRLNQIWKREARLEIVIFVSQMLTNINDSMHRLRIIPSFNASTTNLDHVILRHFVTSDLSVPVHGHIGQNPEGHFEDTVLLPCVCYGGNQ